jgi:sugar porter (SP) family MFS transporter
LLRTRTTTPETIDMLAQAQFRVIAAASLAGLLFGFDTAVISGVTQALRDAFSLSPTGLGLVVSAALWGTLAGALALGRPGDRYGSRAVLQYIGILYVGSALGCALSWSLSSLLVFRFLIGVAIGGSSILAPVYMAEAAPAARRGAMVGLFQINIVVGILIAYVSNFFVADLVGGNDVWRWKLVVAVLPAALFLVLLFLIPQSPRWLISKGRLAEAAASLRRLGGAQPEAEIALIRRNEMLAAGAPAPRLSWLHHRRPIVLAIGMGLFNQLSGINAILYYLADIFGAAGFSSTSASAQSIAIGATNLVATIFAMTVIDRWGRKPLLLIGSIGMALAQGGVAFVMASGAYRALLLPLLVMFIISFAISQGAVIWVFLSEIFPTTVRARGQSVGSATHWIANALISAVFPALAAVSRSIPFAFFSLMMVLQFCLVLRFFPETKGVELERMEGAIARPELVQ